ncbi:MAG: anhydro-N-acetylmuramic acid kinase [Bacteroidales bacterium]
MNHQSQYSVVGMMSGTSLDGLDIASVLFRRTNGKWSYETGPCKYVPYPSELRNQLMQAHQLNGSELARLDAVLGRWYGRQAAGFIAQNQLDPILVANHGQTIFHRPEQGYTLQIGSGAHLASECRRPVVCDFRSQDVALGGQGAPLVPVGDMLLFGDYGACLNLGGFANVSMDSAGDRIAFDIVPCNFVLNALAMEAGMPYDRGGQLAIKGNYDDSLLNRLSNIPWFKAAGPKSLGREWVEINITPLLDSSDLSVEDKLATFTELIAEKISLALSGVRGKVLVSGGGVHNDYLISRITGRVGARIVIAPPPLDDFREALIFGFLGLLRWLEIPNTLPSVTGAAHAVSAGAIYLPR